MTALELHEVTKHFGRRTPVIKAVDGVSLSVEPGEIVAFLGPNGAGKTTTIDMILGLTAPTSGSVTVFGTSPRKAVEAGRVGAVLQTGGLLTDFTVKETVQAIAALQGAQDLVDAAIAQAGLTHLAKQKVSLCSGGEQQRLKMALAILTNPDLLILDEPTTGMDVGVRREFWATMREHASHGRTILFATHYLEEAQDFAQRIVLMAHGRIVADGPIAEVQAMTSGRTLAATLPEGPHDRLLEALRALPGVTGVELNGTRVELTALDSDTVALHMLRAGCRDLVIEAPTLESAFLALTA